MRIIFMHLLTVPLAMRGSRYYYTYVTLIQS